jgi:glycosyltransferase involved in cell wall biosynthesis
MIPRRVLHLSAGNLYGGVETFLATLARLRDLCPGIEPHFGLCFDGRLSKELRAAGVPVHLLGGVRVSRPWTVLQARGRLRRLLRATSFEVLVTHACWPHALFAPPARACRLPVVFWAHDIQAGRHWLDRWARRTRPDLVLANSKVTQASVAGNLFPGVQSEVLYLPVAPPEVGDRAAVRREVRGEFGTAEESVVIVTACRLEAWKGHAGLLDALGQLRDRAGWECWIAGGAQRPEEHQYLAGLRRQVQRLGLTARVRFLGQRADVARVLAAADVHCQPNAGPEPFGIAFVEALYARLPVVTTGHGGALEIVDETCGVLVPPGEVKALAQALGALLSDAGLRARLGAGGPPRALHLCDAARQLRRLAERLARVRGG